jgi:hypothetical protein
MQPQFALEDATSFGSILGALCISLTCGLIYPNLKADPLINLTDITDIKATALCILIEYSE